MNPQVTADIISSNYTPGRVGTDWIVLHTSDCSLRSAEQTFGEANAQRSAHRMVALDGEDVEFVSDGNTAWHAANWYVNQRSFGLEHEDNGNYNDPVRTDAEYATSAAQVAQWCHANGIPCVKVTQFGTVAGYTKVPLQRGIVLHREVSESGTACPDGLDWNRIITQANAILNSKVIVAQQTSAEVHGNYNFVPVSGSVRITVGTLKVHQTPSTAGAGNFANTPDGMLHQGNLATMIGYITNGDSYTIGASTSTVWIESSQYHYYAALGTDFVVPAPAAPAPAPAAVAPALPVAPVTPDYQVTYKEDPQTWITGSDCQAVDATGAGANKAIPANTSVAQAGTFIHNGIQYVRTVYGATHDTWYGIPLSAKAASPVTPAAVVPTTSPVVPSVASVTTSSVDGVQPPASVPLAVIPNAGVVPAIPDKLTFTQELTEMIAALYGKFVALADKLKRKK